jgi:hypothetical protein
VGCEAFFIKKSFFVVNNFLSFVSFLFFFHSQRWKGGGMGLGSIIIICVY